MKRQPGFYWVQLTVIGAPPGWIVAKWNGRWWELPGCTFCSSDKEFTSINENRLTAPAPEPGIQQ